LSESKTIAARRNGRLALRPADAAFIDERATTGFVPRPPFSRASAGFASGAFE
jgi:hypothetical protein